MWGAISMSFGAMSEIVYLLAEDTESDAVLVKMEMERHTGAKLLAVRDGQEAIDYLLGTPPYNDRKQFPLPDIIVMDLKMPRLSGFDFLQWRRTEAPLELRVIPVIVFSGSDLQRDVWRAYELGANRYMVKPNDLATFRKQLSSMCENWGHYTQLVRRGRSPALGDSLL
jgi:CheY-like chemotaxis protein